MVSVREDGIKLEDWAGIRTLRLASVAQRSTLLTNELTTDS